MKILDYKKLNLKCGTETHIQLESSKLFCRCPTIIDNSEPKMRIKRKLRSVAGLEGKKDIATLYEEKRDKTFIYEYSDKYACLTCLDEEPANSLNLHALEIALEIALLLKANILPKIKIMRKIIVDGSNPSSYQRTTLIAKDGKLKTSKGIVRIPTIYLEEDSARRIKQENNSVYFRLDRLGCPLIEIATEPDIKDPEHAKETAELIGMIAKSTGKTKSGIGTIRQDINLSIKDKARVELKGFQNLKQMPKVIEIEVKRQSELLENNKEIKEEVRNVKEDNTTDFLRPLPGKARMYIETDVPIMEIPNSLISSIKIPELLTEKTLKLEKQFHLHPELAKELIKKKINFESLAKKYPRVSPSLIANTIITTPKEIRARFHFEPKLKESDFEFIFNNLNRGKIPKDAIINILIELAKNKKPNLEKYAPISDKELEKIIEKIIAENGGASFNAVMGIAVSKIKNKAEGKKIAEIIKKFI